MEYARARVARQAIGRSIDALVHENAQVSEICTICGLKVGRAAVYLIWKAEGDPDGYPSRRRKAFAKTKLLPLAAAPSDRANTHRVPHAFYLGRIGYT